MSPRQLRRFAVVCALVSAVFCVAPTSAEQAAVPKPDEAPARAPLTDSDAQIRSLKEKIVSQARENLILRRRVKELEARVEELKQSKAVVVPQPGVPGQAQVPPSWKPFEFNGMTYYVVPLRDGEGAPARTLVVPTAPADSK